MKNNKRKETTEFLSKLLIHTRLTGVGKHYASEVTLDFGKRKQKRVDFVQFTPQNAYSVGGIEKGEFTFYEIKSCKEDFNSGHGLTFDGDKNYLVTTMETYKAILNQIRSNDFPYYVGVMVACPYHIADVYAEFENPTPLDAPDTQWELKIIIPAHNHSRERSLTELLFCMVRSGH